MMEKLAERVGDADKEVREALLALLGDCVLPALGPAALAPFLPLLTAHVSAAMTHLNDAIRWGAACCAALLARGAWQTGRAALGCSRSVAHLEHHVCMIWICSNHIMKRHGAAQAFLS